MLASTVSRMKQTLSSDELEERLVQFAIGLVKLSNDLPDTFQGKNFATQLLRSGTSAAPNYAEARAAESRADFIHKLKIALKEMNETKVWLRMARGSFGIETDLLNHLIAENTELCKIFVASIQTARRNLTTPK